jgi:hypothetical protein
VAVRWSATGGHYSRTAGGFYGSTLFTVCFWAVLDVDRNASGALWGLYGAGDTYTVIYNANSDGTSMSIEADGGANIAGPNMVVGRYYFMAVTRNGTGTNTCSFYYATPEAASFTVTTNNLSTTMTPTTEVVGANNFNLSGGWINGRMASLKQWNAVLGADELMQERWSLTPVRTANLFSFHPFLEGGATPEARLDYSGNGRHFSGGTGSATGDNPPVTWRTGRHRIRRPIAAGGGPTQYTLDVGGSLTTAGAVGKQVNQQLAGAL